MESLAIAKKDVTFIRVSVDLAYEIKSWWSSDIHMYSMLIFHCITRMLTKSTQRTIETLSNNQQCYHFQNVRLIVRPKLTQTHCTLVKWSKAIKMTMIAVDCLLSLTIYTAGLRCRNATAERGFYQQRNSFSVFSAWSVGIKINEVGLKDRRYFLIHKSLNGLRWQICKSIVLNKEAKRM